MCWRMEDTVLYFLALRQERDGIAQKYPPLSSPPTSSSLDGPSPSGQEGAAGTGSRPAGVGALSNAVLGCGLI